MEEMFRVLVKICLEGPCSYWDIVPHH